MLAHAEDGADMSGRDQVKDPWIYVENFRYAIIATFLKAFRQVLVNYAKRILVADHPDDDELSKEEPHIEICFLLQEAGCRQQQMHLDSIFPRKAFLLYFDAAASSTVFAAGPNVCTDINLVKLYLHMHACSCPFHTVIIKPFIELLQLLLLIVSLYGKSGSSLCNFFRTEISWRMVD